MKLIYSLGIVLVGGLPWTPEGQVDLLIVAALWLIAWLLYRIRGRKR